MTDKLTSLRQFTTVVADTGDIAAMKLYQPQDATTNPSLILNAAQIPEYRKLIDEAVTWAKAQSNDRAQQVVDATDKLAVNIGLEILKLVPGRISTEVDARLSYDTEASIAKAKRLIKLYNDAGISNDRILIKLASTWQGIRAAEQLEKEGITLDKAGPLIAAGADLLAVITDLFDAPDIAARAAAYQHLFEEHTA